MTKKLYVSVMTPVDTYAIFEKFGGTSTKLIQNLTLQRARILARRYSRNKPQHTYEILSWEKQFVAAFGAGYELEDPYRQL